MAEETQDPQAKTDVEPGDEAKPETNLPENKIDVEDAGTLRKKLTLTIPRERIDSKLDEMFGELSRTAQVPGFRIGRAPRRLVEKRFGKEVGQDVRNALVGESIGGAIEKSELKTIGEPDIDLEKIELPETGEMTFSFEVEVAPEFDLPSLDGVKVEKPVIDIDDRRIDEELDRWRQSRAGHEATDAPAAEGDVVTADVKISGEGIDEFRQGEQTLRVAPGQIEGLPLVDLGKQLAGKKAGEKAELKIDVPQAHPNEAWRGKELSVEISIGQVRRRVLPEIDEQFAASAGFESLDQLRQQIGQALKGRAAGEVQRAMRQQVGRYLLDNTEFDVPEGVAERHASQVLSRRYVELLSRGVPREQIDENLTELQAAASEQAKSDLKLSFILAKVAETEKIEVTEDEVNARVAEMARMYERRPERLRRELAGDGRLAEVEVSVREGKTMDAILAKAKVSEVAPEEQAEKAKATKKAAKKTAKKKTAKKKTTAGKGKSKNSGSK
ncbi:MAG: trigger factor [Planctomycetota bacterium]|nr:trigger factor [Planctomycetota bacterium]